MKMLKQLCLLCLFVAAFAMPAHATDYSITVEGTVTIIYDSSGLLNGKGIKVGTTFSASYTFSDEAVDENTDFDWRGEYYWTTAPYGFAPFKLGTLFLASNNLYIEVGNDIHDYVGGQPDYYFLTSFGLPVGDFKRVYFSMLAWDDFHTAFSSEALPIPALDFSAFQSFTGQISFFTGGPSEKIATIHFAITNVEATPVPPTGPVARIYGLGVEVGGMVASGATLPADGQSLYAKLDAALAALEAGDTATAIARLQDFVVQVDAFVRTGKLTAVQGAGLMNAALAILALL